MTDQLRRLWAAILVLAAVPTWGAAAVALLTAVAVEVVPLLPGPWAVRGAAWAASAIVAIHAVVKMVSRLTPTAPGTEGLFMPEGTVIDVTSRPTPPEDEFWTLGRPRVYPPAPKLGGDTPSGIVNVSGRASLSSPQMMTCRISSLVRPRPSQRTHSHTVTSAMPARYRRRPPRWGGGHRRAVRGVMVVQMRRHTITTTVLAGTAAVLLAACGDESDPTGAVDASEDGTTACTALVGTPTADVIADPQCLDEAGGVVLLGFASYDCPDGRKLSWNDEGWGYSDGPWQAHARPDGQLVPPDADMAACPG